MKQRRPSALSKVDSTDRDLAPSKNYKLENDPLPKGFQRVMRKMESITASNNKNKSGDPLRKTNTLPTTEGKVTKSAKGNKKKVSDNMSMQVGETYKAFSKKARLNERKDKLKEKRRKGKTPDETRMDGHTTLFGTQASAPPTFTQGKAIAALQANLDAGEKDEDDVVETKRPSENDEGDKVGRKTKLKDLPMSQQKIIAEERAKAIETYRLAKLKRGNTESNS
ncbi:hypothetical protein BC829DRAFT_416406 [Chytridium lagenaria]|nr:hypothetical protein BC829DRAFT_416406 [Chytridium lagenaria]